MAGAEELLTLVPGRLPGSAPTRCPGHRAAHTARKSLGPLPVSASQPSLPIRKTGTRDLEWSFWICL